MRVLETIFQRFSFKIIAIAVVLILGVTAYAVEMMIRDTVYVNVKAIDVQQQKIEQLNKDLTKLSREAEEARIKKEQLIRESYPIKVAQQRGYSIEVGKTIIRSAKEFGVRPELIMAIIETEAGPRWKNHDPNEYTATGLMQVEYQNGTAQILARELGIQYGSVVDMLKDPCTNIRLGTYYISKLIRKYGDIPTALTAYNMGEGGMQDYVAYYGTSRSGYARTVINRQANYEE